MLAHLDSALVHTIEQAFATRQTEFASERTVLFIGSESGAEMVAVLDADKHLADTDRALLGIFCNRLSAGLDNFMLSEQIREANRDLEARVASRTRELASANRRLHEQWQRARRVKTFQSEILSTVAHDLKNPLSVVLGRAETLALLIGRSPLQSERCITQLGQIRDSARRMTAMVDRLVEEAMADAVDVTIRREIGDLVDLVHEVVEANRPLCEAKRQTIAVEAPEQIEAAFDQDRLRDAFDNLVSNAVKYSPHGGRILITALREPAEAVVTVSDEGPGLQPEDRERLFGRFERLSAKPTGGETSTGLGLFSAKQIVDLHGGSLAAMSAGPGQGTTFELRLPLGDVAAFRPEADQT